MPRELKGSMHFNAPWGRDLRNDSDFSTYEASFMKSTSNILEPLQVQPAWESGWFLALQ